MKQYHEQFHSATIQSFKFSIDLTAKFTKLYLTEKFGTSFESPNPRLVFRECWNVNLMSEDEFNSINKVIADRNLTAHSYNEEVAEEILQRLPQHYHLIKTIFDRLDVQS